MTFGEEPLNVAHDMGDVHLDDGVGEVVTNDRVEELGVIDVEHQLFLLPYMNL